MAELANAPWVERRSGLPSAPWEAVPERRTRTAAGVLDAIQAGYQGSATGLMVRGGLPDVVLDPSSATWYEKALNTAGQIIPEIPLMAAGWMAGSAVGAPTGAAVGSAVPVIGTAAGAVAGGLLGGGAGSGAVPAAIRTALIEAYKSGTVQSSGGFLASASIIMKATAKEAAVNAATMGAGGIAARMTGSAIAPAIGTSLSVPTATRAIGAAGTTAEVGTMVVSSAALEGRLPEWEDFLNAAVVVGGLKASVGVAKKIGDIYARTGVPPEQVVGMARQDPTLGEALKSADPELPPAFRQAANEESARNAILEPDAAMAFVEKPFAEVPQAPGTPKVKLNVNYDYINSPDEAKAALARASEVYGPTILEQTRGKVSWESTEAEARQRLSELTGADVKTLLTDRTPGTPENAAGLLLRRQLLEGAVDDFTRKARDYDAAKSSPESAIQMLASAERVAMLSAHFQGAASEAGRALNILKNARDTARSAEQVKKLLETYDRDPAQIAAIMRQADNPVQAARAARELVKASPWEKVVEGMKSAMISGPVTMMANVIGNATFIPLRPLVDAVAIPLNAARMGLGLPGDRMSIAEPAARVLGNYQGMVDALTLASKFIQANYKQPMEALRQLDQLGGRKTESQKRAIEGDLGVVIRAPFLTLSVPDMLFRLMIERGEVNAIAARQAAKEGYGVTTREFRERMASIRDNLTPEQQADVTALGERGTFNADLAKGGMKLQGLVKDWHLEFLFPFIRTPANIVKELIRLTPASPLIDTWMKDYKKGGPAADKALAEMIVGGGIAAVVMSLVKSGAITGSADPDPDKSRVKLAAGEQPYSFKAEDGTHYEYQRLQPLGTLVGLAADFSKIYDAFEDPQERDKVTALMAIAFSNAITNQTMLLGLTNIVRAISEPGRFGDRFVQNLAAMPIPGAVAQTAALNDPYMREIHSVIDAVKNRTPARESLQPKVDIFGEFIENRERVGGIGPSRIMKESDDPVRQWAAKLGVSVPKTPDSIELPGAVGDRKLAKVELTPQQQTEYAVTAGRRAHEWLAPLVSAPDWDRHPDMVKKLIYQKVFEDARKVARSQVLPQEQREVEARRIADEVTRRFATP
jgi:hypothetical protein